MISGSKQDKPLPSLSSLVGDYVTWNFLWSYSLAPHGVDARRVFVDNQGNVITTEVYGTTGLVYIDYNGNATFYANEGLFIEFFIKPFSVDNKFVCGFNAPALIESLTVWRYGQRIFIRNPILDYANFNGFVDIMMSPNGRFIAITAWDTGTGSPDLVLLYEGA